MNERLAQTILRLRLERGLMQQWVARKIGINPQRLGRFEKGVTEVPVSVLMRLGEVYGMSLYEIIELAQEAAA